MKTPALVFAAALLSTPAFTAPAFAQEKAGASRLNSLAAKEKLAGTWQAKEGDTLLELSLGTGVESKFEINLGGKIDRSSREPSSC